MPKLRDIFGVTSYLTYGGGKGLYNPKKPDDFEPRLFGVPIHRHFADFRRYHQGNPEASSPNGSNVLQVQRTPQGWHTDDYLKLLKENGIKSIWCIQGKAGFQDTIGKAGKVMPINEGDDPYQVESWADLAHHAQQLAIRYAADTADKLDLAEHYQGAGEYQTDPAKNPGVEGVGIPQAGLDLLYAIQILNEPNFKKSWSNATREIDAKGAATAFYAAYKAVREVSEITLITPPPIGGDIEFLVDFCSEFDQLNNGLPPTNVILAFHWYMREESQNQGDGPDKGASPEFVDAHGFGMELDDLVQDFGYSGWACTETGWSSLPPPDVDKSKQSCPIQEGLTQEESVAALMIRLMFAWGTCKHHKFTTFWHCADNYDSGGYQYGGMCYRQTKGKPDWSKKPQLLILEDFMAKYGDLELVEASYEVEGMGLYFSASLKSETEELVFSWSDGIRYDNDITPMPSISENEPIDPPVDPPIDPPVDPPASNVIDLSGSAIEIHATKEGVTTIIKL